MSDPIDKLIKQLESSHPFEVIDTQVDELVQLLEESLNDPMYDSKFIGFIKARLPLGSLLEDPSYAWILKRMHGIYKSNYTDKEFMMRAELMAYPGSPEYIKPFQRNTEDELINAMSNIKIKMSRKSQRKIITGPSRVSAAAQRLLDHQKLQSERRAELRRQSRSGYESDFDDL